MLRHRVRSSSTASTACAARAQNADVVALRIKQRVPATLPPVVRPENHGHAVHEHERVTGAERQRGRAEGDGERRSVGLRARAGGAEGCATYGCANAVGKEAVSPQTSPDVSSFGSSRLGEAALAGTAANPRGARACHPRVAQARERGALPAGARGVRDARRDAPGAPPRASSRPSPPRAAEPRAAKPRSSSFTRSCPSERRARGGRLRDASRPRKKQRRAKQRVRQAREAARAAVPGSHSRVSDVHSAPTAVAVTLATQSLFRVFAARTRGRLETRRTTRASEA